jgi:hypothetical protein
MTGNSFASGAVAGGVNEAAIKKIMDKVGKDHPDVVQAVSAVLGYAANKAIGQDGNVGATVAWHGTKWNEAAVYEFAAAGASILDAPAALTVGAILYPTTTGDGSIDNVNTKAWPLSVYNIVNGTSGTDTDTSTDIENSGGDGSGNGDDQSNRDPESGNSRGNGTPQPLWRVGPGGQMLELTAAGYELTDFYRIGNNKYEDGHGYDTLGRRFLYGLNGAANLLSGYWRTADGKDDWMEIPFKEARDKFIHLRDALGNQTVLNVTYGEEALIDDINLEIIYNENTHLFVTVKGNLSVPYNYVEGHPMRVSPFSEPYAQLVGSNDRFTLMPKPPLPPNNNMNPLNWPLPQNNNQTDYSNDTSYLYTRNLGIAFTENLGNAIGARYGLKYLGTASLAGGMAADNYLNNKKNGTEIGVETGITLLSGKAGYHAGNKLGINPTVTSAETAAGMATFIEIENKEKKK